MSRQAAMLLQLPRYLYLNLIIIIIIYIYYAGANHAFFNKAHHRLSPHSKVLQTMSDVALHYRLALLMIIHNDVGFNDNIALLMRNKKFYLEKYGGLLAIAQRESVFSLFNVGVRYFHVHLELHDEYLYVSNSLLGNQFSEYLAALLGMMAENPGELVVVHVERTLYDIETPRFDAYAESVFERLAAEYNVTLYYEADESDITTSSGLANIRFGRLITGGRARLIVLYPRRTKLFWAADDQIEFTAPYMYSVRDAHSVINDRHRTGIVNVVRAAVTSDFDEHVRNYVDAGMLQVDIVLSLVSSLLTSSLPENHIANYIRNSTDLNHVILSMNHVTRETASLVISRNGKSFNKHL